jgi:hypothetical protein
MAALDSTAAFFARVRELELGAHEERFKQNKWLTFAKLAFATLWVPGGDEQTYENDITVKGLGSATHDDRGLLRRLFCEAYALSAGDLRLRLEGPNSELPRVVPTAEKLARRKACAQELPGLELKGELDISDALLESAMDMHYRDGLYYMGLEMCTKRQSSLLPKKDKLWEPVPNAAGTFAFRKIEDTTRASCDTQFAYTLAMQRRALALHMADLMSFQLSETLRSKLTAVMMKAPQVGYAWVTMEQAIEADMLFWSLMADEVVEGVKRNAGGRPCDQAFRTVFDSTEFRMAIAPRQVGVSSGPQRPKVTQPPPAGEPTISKRQRKLNNKLKAAGELNPPPLVQPLPPTDKGKGKGKQGKGNSRPNMPKQLIGMCAKSNDATNGQRFCFAYNLGSCSDAIPGQACAKGFHGCMKPLPNGAACSMAHPCTGCTR